MATIFVRRRASSEDRSNEVARLTVKVLPVVRPDDDNRGSEEDEGGSGWRPPSGSEPEDWHGWDGGK